MNKDKIKLILRNMELLLDSLKAEVLTDETYQISDIVPLEEDKDCIYYWGEFIDIDPTYTTENIVAGKIAYVGIPATDKKLQTYRIFGCHDVEIIKQKYTVKDEQQKDAASADGKRIKRKKSYKKSRFYLQ